MKKLLSLLLVLALLLGCVPTFAAGASASPKGKIDPSIKVEMSLDKTTLYRNNPTDQIKVTYKITGGSGNRYEVTLSGSQADGTGGLLVDFAYYDAGTTGTFYVHASDFDTYNGEAKLVLDGCSQILAEGEDEYGPYSYQTGDPNGYFCVVSPTIKILPSEEEPNPIVTPEVKISKQVAQPGDQIDFTFAFKNLPAGFKKVSMIALYCYVHEVKDGKVVYSYSYDTYNTDYYKDYTKGTFTVTAPDFGDEIDYLFCYNVIGDGWEYYHSEHYIVSLKEKTLDSDTLSFGIPDSNVVYLKKTGPKETLQIKVKCSDSSATVPTFKWTSDKPAVASVNSKGLITANTAGTAVITGTATVADKTYKHKITVHVLKDTSAITKIKPNKTMITLKKGKKFTVTVKFTPATVYNNKLTWKSSNKKVATVTNGVITAKGKGKCTITVTTAAKPQKKATIKVTVK